MTVYGDISPRTAALASREMLKRGMPVLVLEKFGQAKPLPMNSSKAITFRRYEALDPTPKVLTEGVTPNASTLTNTDVTATLSQYGDRVMISDVIGDTHEDPVFMEAQGILGEQAAQMIEIVRFNVLKAGTNVFYTNGTARSDVNTPMTRMLQRRITRALKGQHSQKISSVVRSTPSFNTENVAPAFIGLVHPDCEGDIRNMDGFVPVENYGQLSSYETELGKVEDVRYVTSTIFQSWANAGGAHNGMITTGGANADVYPILFIARNAYGIVPLKGKQAITPMVVNPQPSDSDPLGQRGHVGWKSMQTAVILNDLWMVRAEVGATL